MGITLDVWCNADVKETPKEIQSADKGPLDDDDADPCMIYISMEHTDGCVYVNLHPYLIVLGTFMMMSGICL